MSGTESPGEGRSVTVPLDLLALVLYLPKPTVNYETSRCVACGQAAGAHYCQPREQARTRLERIVTEALDG